MENVESGMVRSNITHVHCPMFWINVCTDFHLLNLILRNIARVLKQSGYYWKVNCTKCSFGEEQNIDCAILQKVRNIKTKQHSNEGFWPMLLITTSLHVLLQALECKICNVAIHSFSFKYFLPSGFLSPPSMPLLWSTCLACLCNGKEPGDKVIVNLADMLTGAKKFNYIITYLTSCSGN